VLLVDQSSPNFLSPNVRSTAVFPIFKILLRFEDICDRSLKLSEMAPNSARFGPQFFLGGGELLDLDYKTENTSDHVAKFQGDRPTELGDLPLKIKKHQH